ncbi:MAG: hypothetical protein L6Q99_02690 [Planctomycetes bacterium]|nr:hypothetical protein [Planctomycetota bacterium]
MSSIRVARSSFEFPTALCRRSLALLALTLAAASSSAQAKLVGWGGASFDSTFSAEAFVEADAGGYFTIARRADGTFAALGLNGFEIGGAPALPSGVTYTKLVATSGHVLALRSDGSVIGWPDAGVGHAPFFGQAVVDIAAGSGHALALLANGGVIAWGDNGFGQCLVPSLPSGVTYVGIGAGSYTSFAMRSDGTAVGWGNNAGGERDVPPPPSGLTYTQISGGWYHSAGILSDGTIVTWGLDFAGQLNVPALPSGVTYTKVSCGTANSVALRSDGQIVGWGHNVQGQCDAPALPSGVTYVDVTATRLPNTVYFFSHCAALRSDGKVVTFGWNGFSQRLLPELASGVSFVDIDASEGGVDLGGPIAMGHTLALTSDGNVLAWGDETNGQTNVPALPVGKTYVEISAGGLHSVARLSDGTVVDWGNDSWGQLGGTPGLNDFVAIEAGAYHNLGLRQNGNIYAWGYGGGGVLAVPALPSGVTYVEIAAGSFSLARRSDGSVVAWGPNNYGQTNVPALPSGLTYVEISAGRYHGLALRSDGSVVAWGNNSWGQCNVPTLPANVVWTAIRAGWNYSAGKTSDGLIRVWGDTANYKNQVPALAPGQRFSTFAAGELGLVARIDTAWTKYCTAKVNSLGCTPAIHAYGEPNSSLAFGFGIQCTSVRNQKPGLLMYTVNGQRANVTFQCGTLCIGPGGVRRAPLVNSGGSGLPTNDCSGIYFLDMNAFAAGAVGGNPDPALSVSGTVVHTQWWGRDPGFTAPCNTTLSDAIEYTVVP